MLLLPLNPEIPSLLLQRRWLRQRLVEAESISLCGAGDGALLVVFARRHFHTFTSMSLLSRHLLWRVTPVIDTRFCGNTQLWGFFHLDICILPPLGEWNDPLSPRRSQLYSALPEQTETQRGRLLAYTPAIKRYMHF